MLSLKGLTRILSIIFLIAAIHSAIVGYGYLAMSFLLAYSLFFSISVFYSLQDRLDELELKLDKLLGTGGNES